MVVGGPYPRSVGRNPGALPSAVLWPAHFHARFCHSNITRSNARNLHSYDTASPWPGSASCSPRSTVRWSQSQAWPFGNQVPRAEPRAKGLLFLDSFFALELTNHRVFSFHAASHRNRNRNHPTSSNFSQVSQRVVQLPLTQLRACDPARLSWAVTQPGSSRGQPQGILDVRNDGMNQSSSVNRADGRFPPAACHLEISRNVPQDPFQKPLRRYGTSVSPMSLVTLR